MGFFANFWTWLNAQLATYIGTKTAVIAAAILPAAVGLATIYVMIWGYLELTGRIKEPILTGAVRIFTLIVVFGVAIHLWLYNAMSYGRSPSALQPRRLAPLRSRPRAIHPGTLQRPRRRPMPFLRDWSDGSSGSRTGSISPTARSPLSTAARG